MTTFDENTKTPEPKTNLADSNEVQPPEQKQQETSLVDSSLDQRNDMNQDVDPENEIQGIKLVLIHTAICLCTFLVGLVSSRVIYAWGKKLY